MGIDKGQEFFLIIEFLWDGGGGTRFADKEEISSEIGIGTSETNSLLYGNTQYFRQNAPLASSQKPVWSLTELGVKLGLEWNEILSEDEIDSNPFKKWGGDEMFCENGIHLQLGRKDGEHNFCLKCEGIDGKLLRLWPHDVYPLGDQSEPTGEHFIVLCGYSARKDVSNGCDRLKYAVEVKNMNREGCCPNFEHFALFGPPRSLERTSRIFNHLHLLLTHPQFTQSRDVNEKRKNDLLCLKAWCLIEEIQIPSWVDSYN